MTKSFTGRKRIRKTFGVSPEITTMPNLIEVQKATTSSLQVGVTAENRRTAASGSLPVGVPDPRLLRKSELRIRRS